MPTCKKREITNWDRRLFQATPQKDIQCLTADIFAYMDIFDNFIDKMCKYIYNRVGYLYAFCRKVYSILHS